MKIEIIQQHEKIIDAISKQYRISGLTWEDIRQEIYLKLIETPEPIRNPRGLIRRVATNHCNNLFNKANRDAMAHSELGLTDCYFDETQNKKVPFRDLTFDE